MGKFCVGWCLALLVVVGGCADPTDTGPESTVADSTVATSTADTLTVEEIERALTAVQAVVDTLVAAVRDDAVLSRLSQSAALFTTDGLTLVEATGMTFVYTRETGYVRAADRTDAPDDAVRFVLYRMSGTAVATPLTEVGHLDFFPRPSGDFGVQVVSGGVPTLGYEASGVYGRSQFQEDSSNIRAVGSIGLPFRAITFTAFARRENSGTGESSDREFQAAVPGQGTIQVNFSYCCSIDPVTDGYIRIAAPPLSPGGDSTIVVLSWSEQKGSYGSSLKVNEVAYNGSRRSPTLEAFWTRTTSESIWDILGLAAHVLTPALFAVKGASSHDLVVTISTTGSMLDDAYTLSLDPHSRWPSPATTPPASGWFPAALTSWTWAILRRTVSPRVAVPR